MNQAAADPATEGAPRGCTKEGFYGKKGGDGAVNKERNIILVLDTFSLGDEKGEGFQHADFLFLRWGVRRAHVTGDTTATVPASALWAADPFSPQVGDSVCGLMRGCIRHRAWKPAPRLPAWVCTAPSA